jgi:CBS domain-containing protein
MRLVSQILEAKERRIVAVAPESTVLDAVRAMAEHNVSSVLVMRGGELQGIVTERDYARKIVLQGRTSADTPVSTVMSHPVQCVAPDASVDACMELMTERRIRHLPVREAGAVVGVISIGDLVKAVIEEQREEIAQLQQYIAG